MEKIIYIIATLFFIGLAVFCFGVYNVNASLYQKSKAVAYDLTAIESVSIK
jgi:hypothetical protein